MSAVSKPSIDFFRDGVVYALQRRGRILLADDMGLGKTIQALAIASAYQKDWPLLIVCPSSVRFSWRSAIFRWLPSVPEEDVIVITSGKILNYLKKWAQNCPRVNFAFMFG